LPITNGLALWLDAATLNAAFMARKITPPKNSGPIEAWLDGCGNGRDFSAGATQARPTFRADLVKSSSPSGVVRFDGVDDFLVWKNSSLAVEDFTLFVVAAPHSNAGGFRAFFSANATGKNDYLTGLNLDQSAGSQTEFNTVNIEGRGFSGINNLLNRAFGFHTFHTLTVSSAKTAKNLQLFVDGQATGQRSRQPGKLSFDEMRLGARHYSNTAEPTFDSGFFHGDLAEVLLFDRALTERERGEVETYLQKKHAALFELKGPPPEPVLRVLMPGFTVKELPVELNNINYLEYAPDGRLFALGYDGRVHVLLDTNGDGLEDRVEPYWYKPTLKVPVSMAVRPEGVYVTSSRKLSLLRDTDGDGLADTEEIVAEGWVLPDDPAHGGGIDCMAVAFDGEGNIYFGLGCADYTNAYRVRDGKSHYDIRSERGTILKLSADRKRREIFCTGIRFPYTLAFNRHGDLFCTDQEGETWLPGGNPLDELNHLIKGRHYAFPPRHPVHLPNVIDEPPVIGFGPQHQSTCGMVFNEARPLTLSLSPGGGEGKANGPAERKSFGPDFWEGDALVAGYSRGKVWRAKLVKTPAGYVGKEQLIISARMLLADVAVSPQGDLVAVLHSGGPDWGSGPSGKGRLVKVLYGDRSLPQPVVAWANSPLEIAVAFDKPLDPSIAKNFPNSTIEYGEYVRAADRFEVHRPGYKVVQDQQKSFRGKLDISDAKLSPDRRTLLLSTAPHPQRATYALTIPGLGTNDETAEFAYDLNGMAATWEAAPGKSPPDWRGWLPHLDMTVNRAMAAGSAEHERLWKLLELEGSLTMRGQVKPLNEQTTLKLEANQSFEGSLARRDFKSAPALRGKHEVTLILDSAGEPTELSVKTSTGHFPNPLQLHASFHTATDPTERPLPLSWIALPWAPAPPPKTVASSSPPAELAGGDFQRGKEIFFGDTVKCSQCHTIRGEGGKVGPDLSNLIYKDAASVWRDIAEPNATINPDYVNYTVRLKDGEEHTGLLRPEGADRLRVLNAANTEGILIKRDAVTDMRPEALSIMPTGLDTALSDAGRKDLLTFLLNATPPTPAANAIIAATPKRTRDEVNAVLQAKTSALTNATPRNLKIILVAGPKDHGPGEHDYPLWQKNWEQLLGQAANVRVTTAQSWPNWDQWIQADLVVFYFWNHDWNEAQFRELDRHLARGGGVVVLHSATIMDKNAEQLAARIGLAWQGDRCKFRHGPLDLKITAPAGNSITCGLAVQVHFHDESYWPMIGDENKIQVLATAVEEDQPRPMIWTFQPGKGRVFCSILGHYYATFDDPLFRAMVLRGMAWAAGDSGSRFDSLITIGVKLADEP
jgi:putative heme-binding domain-containing protein